MSLNHPGPKTPIALLSAYCDWPRTKIAIKGNSTKRFLKGYWIEWHKGKKEDQDRRMSSLSGSIVFWYSFRSSKLPDVLLSPTSKNTRRYFQPTWSKKSRTTIAARWILFPAFSVAFLSIAAQFFFKYLQKPWLKSDQMLEQSKYERKPTLGVSYLSKHYFSFLSCPR